MALDKLIAAGTHAEAAGVHRVTVSLWVSKSGVSRGAESKTSRVA